MRMSGDDKWLENFSQFGPATKKAVEVIDKVTGMLLGPKYVQRMSQVEAARVRMLAEARADAMGIEARAKMRIEFEQVVHQRNMEAVVFEALPHLKDKADPSKVEEDWIARFFGFVREIGRDDLRKTWGRILAGEFNKPGSFSLRLLNIVSQMDTGEAQLFNSLCGFAIEFAGDPMPVVLNLNDPLYSSIGLNVASVSDFEGLGLLQFQNNSPFSRTQLPKRVGVRYHGKALVLEFGQDTNNELPVGKVMLTNPGRQLAAVCETSPVDGFAEYLKKYWARYGITLILDGDDSSAEVIVDRNF